MEKINASNFIDEERFWNIIEISKSGDGTIDNQEQLLKRELEKLTEKELFGFMYHYYNLSAKLHNGDLWLVPFIVLGVCSDDTFDYFRDWLISRGKDIYYKALENPDSLCDEFDLIAYGDEPTFEGLGYVYTHVFEEKFKKDFYYEEDKYDFGDALKRKEISFNWKEDDIESMKKICPNIFKKWWHNDRF